MSAQLGLSFSGAVAIKTCTFELQTYVRVKKKKKNLPEKKLGQIPRGGRRVGFSIFGNRFHILPWTSAFRSSVYEARDVPETCADSRRLESSERSREANYEDNT